MLSPREALQHMLAAATLPPSSRRLPVADSLGATLSADVPALQAVPAFDNSAMDGYALRAADAVDGSSLPVSQRVFAGGDPQPLPAGTAARIFTGAPLPEGADCVAAQEACTEAANGVTVEEGAVAAGRHVRRRGEDIAAGSIAVQRGRRVRPQDLGLLASVGVAEVDVYRPLRVAVLVTGDELREAGSGLLAPGEIYNSNGPMLSALVHRCGMQVGLETTVADDRESVRRALADAADAADVILSTGGVSVGDADHVREQVERLGSLSLWRIALKPGKPLAFGRVGEVPFIGLPGNPSSVFVTFAVLARPFLLACQGNLEPALPRLAVRAGFDLEVAGSREEYLRVMLVQTDAGLEAVLAGNQSSGALSATARAQAFAVVPAGTRIEHGNPVDVILLDALIP